MILATIFKGLTWTVLPVVIAITRLYLLINRNAE